MKSIPEIMAAFAHTDICKESVDWASTHTTAEDAASKLSAEWYIVGAAHYVRSEAAPIDECAAVAEDLLRVFTLRPVPSHIETLIATLRARLAAPATNDKAKRVRLKAAFESMGGIWASIGKPVELEPLVLAKLRPFVDFDKFVDTMKK